MKKTPQKGSKIGVYFYQILFLIKAGIDSLFKKEEVLPQRASLSKWEKQFKHHEELIKGMI